MTIASVKVIPCRAQADGLRILTGSELAAFLADLAVVSEPLVEPYKVQEAWNAFADAWLERSLAQDLITISSDLLSGRDLCSSWLNEFSRRGRLQALAASFLRPILVGRPSDAPRGTHSRRAAAILRNRLATPAHRELYLTALGRHMADRREPSPQWARDLILRWGTFP